MTSLHFQPAASGGWLAIACAPRLLLLAAGTDDALVELAWSTIGQSDGFPAVLEVLTRGGLSAMPPFLLLEWTEEDHHLRAIVRGGLALQVTDDSGQNSLSGLGVSTWTERTFTGMTDAVLVISDAQPAAPRDLPLVAGVALVVSVNLRAEGATSPVPAKAQEPKAQEPKAQEPKAQDPKQGTPKQAAPKPVAQTPREATPPAVETAVSEATVVPHASEVTSTGSAEPGGTPTAYDYLFGDTVFRSVSDAAVPEPGEEDAAAAELDGDHDGHTVLTSDIAKLRAGRKSKRGAQEPPLAPAPPKLVLELSTGGREPLTQPILVGRSPSVSKVSGGQLPRLVVMGGVDQDISRNHAQFSLEGDTVVVTDLHSRNGTRILLPGKAPQTLRAGEPTSVIVGTIVDLGGGITLTIGEE